jgi:hypothetical protein
VLRFARALPALVLLLSSACGSSSPPVVGADAAQPDTAGPLDADARDALGDDAAVADVATSPDARVADAQVDGGAPADTGSADAGSVPTPGFGVISGPCGVLDEALTSTSPATFVNHIDFGTDPYDAADYTRLSEGGREMIDDGNAGGSSLYSEVFSYELLHRCEGAGLLKTETEILYDPPQGRITDILVEIDGLKIGVSVTRAVAFPFDAPYPPERARTLMEEKLSGILESTGHVAPADAWRKQILYVIAYAEGHVAVLEAALAAVDPAVRADTVVMITVSDGDDGFIY